MHVSRRAILVGALALASIAQAQAQAQTTINFLGTEDPATFVPVIEAYQATHPDIMIEYQQIPFGSFNAQIESRLGTQDPSIDLFQADTPRVPALASRGYLMDLSAYADQIAAIATKTEQSAVSYQGTYYAFPMWTGTQLLFYNVKLFDAAGLAHPSDDPAKRMTWEETLDLAKKAQAAGAEFGFTFNQVDRYFQLQPLFESIGAGSGLTGDDLMTPDITGEKWVETAKWYQDTFESGISPRGVEPGQMPDLFINGQVAMIYGGLPLVRRFKKADGLEFGIAPVPYFAGGKPVTSTGSWAVGVSPYTTHKDIALDFARFMTLDKAGATKTMEVTSAVPVNQEVYPIYAAKLAELSKGLGDAGRILTYEIQNTAVPRPRSRGYIIFEEIMNRTFADIRNSADVPEALSAASAQLTSALSRF